MGTQKIEDLTESKNVFGSSISAEKNFEVHFKQEI